MKTKEEIQEIIDRIPHRRYGRVNLPYGLYTKGMDRSPTKNIIFPKSLEGKSLLDVGSACGYWCFEAEDLGATKVLGIEIKHNRLRHARVFKELRESQSVVFSNEDITNMELEGVFDYVLALNILHHLPKPVKVVNFLKKKAKEKLIIESPIMIGKVDIMEEIERAFENVEFFPSDLTGPRNEKRKIAICTIQNHTT